MNKDIITKVLQEILQEDPNYFLPQQLHVLSWKSKKINGALITKINGQRYLGFLKKDKAGQDYWSYKLLTNLEPNNSSSATPDTPSPVKNEVSAQPLEENERNPDSFSTEKGLAQIKKFREKYGEFSVKQKYGTPNQSQKST